MAPKFTITIRPRPRPPPPPRPRITLDSLSLDAILNVVAHLSTLRDISALVRTTRTLYRLTGAGQDAWRVVVHRFLGVCDVPLAPAPDYAVLADRLTWVSKCWARRTFRLTSWEVDSSSCSSSRREGGGGQGGPSGGRRRGEWGRERERERRRRLKDSAHVFVDAALVQAGKGRSWRELVIWGAGEDLCARWGDADWRRLSSSLDNDGNNEEEKQWVVQRGKDVGFSSQVDDVTGVCIVDRGGEPGVLVGRGRGQLELINASSPEEFGKSIRKYQRFREDRDPSTSTTSSSSSVSSPGSKSRGPWSGALRFVQWDRRSDLVVTGDGLSMLRLYAADDPVPRSVVHNLGVTNASLSSLGHLATAKFLRGDTLVCGFSNARGNPVQVATIRPDLAGVQLSSPFSSSAADIAVHNTSRASAVRAIEPLHITSSPSASESVVLTAWSDGTCRLIDVRSPAAYDALFRDSWGYYANYTALLLRGAQDFVAADSTGLLFLFDMRMRRAYAHTDAMPCSSRYPQATLSTPPSIPLSFAANAAVARCDPPAGVQCTWHTHAAQDQFRPDSALYVSRGEQHAIYSLASASHLSSSFYVGRRGGLAEMNLGQRYLYDARLEARARSAGWHAERMRVVLVETGIGRQGGDGSEDGWREGGGERMPSTWVPKMMAQYGRRPRAADGDGDGMAPRLDWEYAPHDSVRAHEEWPPADSTI